MDSDESLATAAVPHAPGPLVLPVTMPCGAECGHHFEHAVAFDIPASQWFYAACTGDRRTADRSNFRGVGVTRDRMLRGLTSRTAPKQVDGKGARLPAFSLPFVFGGSDPALVRA